MKNSAQKKMKSKSVSSVGKVKRINPNYVKGIFYQTGPGTPIKNKNKKIIKSKPKTYAKHMKSYSKSPMFKAGRKRQRKANKA